MPWLRLACVTVLTLSVGCLHAVAVDVPAPPHPRHAVWVEIQHLEGSPVCRLTRDYMLEELVPYLEGIEKIR